MIKILLSMLLVGIVAAQNASNDTTTEPFVTTESTITTTKLQPTTKAPSSFVNVTIPKNSPNYTCLKLQSDMKMSIKYAQQFNATTVINATVDLDFPSSSYDYDGTCEKDKVDTVTITFLKTWSLYMEYTLDKSNKYELASIVLTYTITDDIFPNATKDSLDKQFVANASGLTLFEGSKDSAYKCNAKTTVELDSMVNLILSNYLAQPFYEKPNGDFGTAIDCAADTTGTNKLVPIIVGAALAFLVILVLIAYLIGRRRHRSGYQSV